MLWHLSHRYDPAAVALADRHYSRQKPGTPQFVPPGRCLVLLTEGAQALWVTSWPMAEFTHHRWAGAWVNTLFRREGGALASELIGEAVAATRAYFGDPPALGMVTFVAADRIRHKRDPGRCYRKAGFVVDGATQKAGHIALRLAPESMPAPEAPHGWLFGRAA